MEVLEANKLIAGFMGYCFDEEMKVFRVIGSLKRVWADLNYHKDWKLLMPVVDKISRTPLIGAEDHKDVCYPITFNMPTEDGKVMVRFCGFQLHTADTLIEATYAAVVDFIQFENENKNKLNEKTPRDD
jgi:hypothetical protein